MLSRVGARAAECPTGYYVKKYTWRHIKRFLNKEVRSMTNLRYHSDIQTAGSLSGVISGVERHLSVAKHIVVTKPSHRLKH